MLQHSGEAFVDEGTPPPYAIEVLGIPMVLYLWALAGHRLWSEAKPSLQSGPE
jgi:hypothetical protein